MSDWQRCCFLVNDNKYISNLFKTAYIFVALLQPKPSFFSCTFSSFTAVTFLAGTIKRLLRDLVLQKVPVVDISFWRTVMQWLQNFNTGTKICLFLLLLDFSVRQHGSLNTAVNATLQATIKKKVNTNMISCCLSYSIVSVRFWYSQTSYHHHS